MDLDLDMEKDDAVKLTRFSNMIDEDGNFTKDNR